MKKTKRNSIAILLMIPTFLLLLLFIFGMFLSIIFLLITRSQEVYHKDPSIVFDLLIACLITIPFVVGALLLEDEEEE